MSNKISEEKKDFFSDIWDLEKMLMWVREEINKANVVDADCKKIELSMEEALVNIIHHAYKDDNKGEINIIIRRYADHLQFELKDKGVPFNPLFKKIRKNSHLSLDEIREGGLGIKLIRFMMDSVSYQRKDGCNILVLIKKI